MTHQFSRVPSVEIPRSSFDRSHGVKTTFDGGFLVPVFVDEALPGDTFNLKMTAFTRLATPLKPVMDNMHMDSFFFAVPKRLLWKNWQKFNGEQQNPTDSTDFTVPTFQNTAGVGFGSLYDYLGIPPGVTHLPFSALYARAYNLIWNEWFRDQNLQFAAPFSDDDAAGDPADYFNLRRRGKRHDYFTSALPFPQKGDPVSLPISGFATVNRTADDSQPTFYTAGTPGSIPLTKKGGGVPGQGTNDTIELTNAATGANSAILWGTSIGLRADLSEATTFTINALREAFQIQRMYERDARGGTRYTEILRSHFGVISPDQRLQRPEYLGGGSSRININPVAQTSSTVTTGDASPQGNLAAIGTGEIHGHGFTKSFTEHCVLIGLVSVRADLTYQQGLNRMYSRQTRFDFYWPSLAHLGEQTILNQEIYAQSGTSGVNPANEAVFGYQERYAEYRYKPSMITGKFRSKDPQTLDVWHLSQNFSELPQLNNAFIEDNPPIDRIIAVQNEPHFLFDGYFDLKCARPMPLYGVPGMIDHF